MLKLVKIVLATTNKDKIKEIKAIFSGSRLTPMTLKDFDTQPELVETGNSFLENAVQKAAAVSEYYGMAALADDSGLEVDALNGAPGILSARYAGEDAGDRANNAKLLAALADVPKEKRTARYRCVAACVIPPDRVITTEGVLEGSIARKPQGNQGFGYDPVFIPKGMRLTCAQLSTDEKNAISHRGHAFRKMRALLEREE